MSFQILKNSAVDPERRALNPRPWKDGSANALLARKEEHSINERPYLTGSMYGSIPDVVEGDIKFEVDEFERFVQNAVEKTYLTSTSHLREKFVIKFSTN